MSARLEGWNASRYDPRRAQPVFIEVIIEAWRRGWSENQIAFAAGVSHQSIGQRIARYEKKHGATQRIERPSLRSAKVFWRCTNCGLGEWSRRIRLKGSEDHYCSLRCLSDFMRKLPDSEIERAIILRREGNSWSHIAKLIGSPMQTIQKRIWKYLYSTGQLNRNIIEKIWVDGHPGQGRPPAWSWLEYSTGIYCVEAGAVVGARYKQQQPWGIRLLDDAPNNDIA